MLLLVLKILVICTSSLAWIVLSSAWILLYRLRTKKKESIVFAIVILAVLWTLTSFDTWYEGFFLFRQTALIPGLDSWALTLLTPLLYLFCRYRITGQFPGRWQWARHLSIAVALAGIYVGMSFVSPQSDRLIYSWHEFTLYYPAWWTLFRIGCSLLWVVQLGVCLLYLSHMARTCKRSLRHFFIRKETGLALCVYILFVVNLLACSYIINILYNCSVILLGGYLLQKSAFYRSMKGKLSVYFIPRFIFRVSDSQAGEAAEGEPAHLFTPEMIERMDQLLRTSGLLYDPDLTLGMLARHLSTNATYLSRYFNRQLGVSFSEYITACRLDKAEILLKETDKKIVEISEEAGFQTLSTFYLSFNARHQMPPSQWRKSAKALPCEEENS